VGERSDIEDAEGGRTMRGVTDVSGLRDIKSMRSGKRSIPRIQTSAYLDLYMLRKEMDRLEKEAALLEKRRQGIQKRLRDIQRQMEALEKSAQRQGTGAERKRPGLDRTPEKSWKTMPLNY
jgi:predicted  nucleic acid-binding Zn-ribbon protein